MNDSWGFGERNEAGEKIWNSQKFFVVFAECYPFSTHLFSLVQGGKKSPVYPNHTKVRSTIFFNNCSGQV